MDEHPDDCDCTECLPRETFEWNRDVGNYSPWQAVRDCQANGESFRQYAEGYRDGWSFGDEPPADLVEGMVREMERAAAELNAEL